MKVDFPTPGGPDNPILNVDIESPAFFAYSCRVSSIRESNC
jgi:hypothetical protein